MGQGLCSSFLLVAHCFFLVKISQFAIKIPVLLFGIQLERTSQLSSGSDTDTATAPAFISATLVALRLFLLFRQRKAIRDAKGYASSQWAGFLLSYQPAIIMRPELHVPHIIGLCACVCVCACVSGGECVVVLWLLGRADNNLISKHISLACRRSWGMRSKA